MARRKRRKTRFLPRFRPYLIALILLAAISGICYAVWQTHPSVLAKLRARTAGLVKPQDEKSPDTTTAKERGTARQAVSPSAQDLTRLKNENAALRAQIRALRDQLKQTSQTLARKTTELEDLQLRLLIRQKMRPQGQ